MQAKFCRSLNLLWLLFLIGERGVCKLQCISMANGEPVHCSFMVAGAKQTNKREDNGNKNKHENTINKSQLKLPLKLKWKLATSKWP